MKRLSVLFTALLAFGLSSFASNEYNVLWVLNNQTTFNNVANYVDASSEQKQQLSEIFYDAAERLKNALIKNDQNAAMDALYFNLANAKAILSTDQYKKYLTILNKTYIEQQDVFAIAK
ncbi:MAG: hypothetical protein E6767_01980 [Dysgonomonas sp.]|nr:hypothetical protein [Dysgonomonas sp.]